MLILLLVGAVGYWLFWPSAPRVDFGVEVLEFAEQRAGETSEPTVVLIRNLGERPLLVDSVAASSTDEPDFVVDSEDCTGVELAPDSGCRVGVRFAPLAVGPRTGELELAGNMRGKRAALPLTGAAIAPRLVGDPPVLDFGSESVGATTPGSSLRLRNDGTHDLEISKVTVGAEDDDFRIIGNECSSQTLAPDESCEMRLVFRPALLGDRVAELAVVSDSFGETPAIGLRGRGTGPDLEIDPPGLVFAQQLVGTKSAAQDLELTNIGDEAMRISRIALKEQAEFTMAGDNCSRAALDPGESCRVEVVFAPRAAGNRRTSLEIRQSAGGLAPGIAISGTGIAPKLELSASSIGFAAQLVGQRSATTRLRVSNSGSAPLAISGLRLGGDQAAAFQLGEDDCSGANLAPKDACNVELSFEPDQGGDLTARLEVRSDVPGGAPAVSLSGRGLAPRISKSRSRLDFVSVRQTESQDLWVDLENTGDAPLEVDQVALGGDHRGDFAVSSDACKGRSVAPGQTCRIGVRFRPQANGPRDARLMIRSNAGGQPQVLVLRGSGSPAPKAGIGIQPAVVSFGPVSAGERSEVITLRVLSTGEGRLELGRIRIEGENAGEFRIVPGTCEGLPYLVPRSDCSVGFRFLPTGAGPRRARLVIEHNAEGGPLAVALDGEGI